MAKNYKEVPQWWYLVVLVGSFVLGLIVVTTQNITLPVWAYIVALLMGIFIAPLVSLASFTTRDCPIFQRGPQADIVIAEYYSVFSLRKRHRHQQPFQDGSRPRHS